MALTKVTNSLLDLGADTSSLNLPKGTTAQRPSSPVAGMVRENTDDNVIEYYNGTEWKQVKNAEPPIQIEYLVVAGGGGGSSAYYGSSGGGGGAGGLSTNTIVPASGLYTITVGAGGAGALAGGNPSYNGSNGANSSINSIIAIGGGGAGTYATTLNGLSGGSGGGAALNGTAGAGTPGQGFAGGNGYIIGDDRTAGGGGGAGEPGGNGVSTIAGDGGDGIQLSITGTPTYYAGGGAGGADTYAGPVTQGNPGLGGGGSINDSGDANTGGGGGASTISGAAIAGQAGGSGVVILRLKTSQYSGTTTGSPTITTDGSHTVLTYTQSGTYTA